MIVDSSALVAIALNEPESPSFVEALAKAEASFISSGTWIELSAVAVRKKILTHRWLERARSGYRIEITPVSVEQARIGHEAYRQYGLGSGHRARLNFGDCFAYALAKATGEPLLYKGDDFVHTDIVSAA